MDKEKERSLNDKLAKWVDLPENYPWPNMERRPNFTSSLDACFGHLVPRVVEELMRQLHAGEYQAYRKLFEYWHEELMGWSERPSTLAFVVYPALTLCLAIEKIAGLKEGQ